MDLEDRFKLRGEAYDQTIQTAETELAEVEKVSFEGRRLGILDEARYTQKKDILLEEYERNKKSKTMLDHLKENFAALWSLPDTALRIPCDETALNNDLVYLSSSKEMQEKFRNRTLTETEYWTKVFPLEEENREDPLYTVSQKSGIGQKRLHEIMKEFCLSAGQVIELQDLAEEYKSDLSHLVSSYLQEGIPSEEIERFLEARENFYVHGKISPSGCPVQKLTVHPTNISLVRIYKAVGNDINSLETIMDRLSEKKILTPQEFRAFTDHCEDCAIKGITNAEMIMDWWEDLVKNFGEYDSWDTVSNRRCYKALEYGSLLERTKDVYNGGVSPPYPVVKM